MEPARADVSGRRAHQDLSLTEREFARISALFASIAGIHMPPSNRALVFSRLSRRLRQLGLQRFDDYIDLLESGDHPQERDVMIAALTTNTTRFFREPYHFTNFAEEILPGLKRDAAKGARIRLWSAGCATGEEPYSLAAVVLKDFPRAGEHDFKILATDISRDVLAVAQTGIYPQTAVESVPAPYGDMMFEPLADGRCEIRPEMKALISFRYLNFMEPWPVNGPFQTVFCRNVVIYMEPAMQSRIWAGLAAVMPRGATLFIGHSERIGGELDDRFKLAGKTSFHRK